MDYMESPTKESLIGWTLEDGAFPLEVSVRHTSFLEKPD